MQEVGSPTEFYSTAVCIGYRCSELAERKSSVWIVALLVIPHRPHERFPFTHRRLFAFLPNIPLY